MLARGEGGRVPSGFPSLEKSKAGLHQQHLEGAENLDDLGSCGLDGGQPRLFPPHHAGGIHHLTKEIQPENRIQSNSHQQDLHCHMLGTTQFSSLATTTTRQRKYVIELQGHEKSRKMLSHRNNAITNNFVLAAMSRTQLCLL